MVVSVKVIVTGGRDYGFVSFIGIVLNKFPIDLLIQGGAGGADYWAKEWARTNHIPYKTYEADWKQGKKAGPMRNFQMLEENQDAIVIAFPVKNVTHDCIKQAKKLGMVILKVVE